jgi:hypothetical protein
MAEVVEPVRRTDIGNINLPARLAREQGGKAEARRRSNGLGSLCGWWRTAGLIRCLARSAREPTG